MYILGISSGLKAGHHDGAAVLLKDGKLIFACEEERFTNTKHARGELPLRVIRYILNKFKLKIEDIDHVCSPLKTYKHYNKRLELFFEHHFGFSPHITLYDHHICHASSSFFASGLNESAIVCLDNSGDSKSGGIYYGKNNNITKVHEFSRNDSLGMFYGIITQFLGYQMTSDEYKVMGMASYGKSSDKFNFNKIINFTNNKLKLNLKVLARNKFKTVYNTDLSTRQERVFTNELEKILKIKPRIYSDKINRKYINFAASAQRHLENITKSICKYALKLTGSNNLCLAGGIALNCKSNMEVFNYLKPLNFYVPSVPNDSGVALGAALCKAKELNYKVDPIYHAYYGPKYSNSEIFEILKNNQIIFKEINDPSKIAAESILNGKIIANFNGNMEFGPRALGARSILADPRVKKIKNIINKKIKYREDFRPFCPSVLYKKQNKYFQNDKYLPFMNVTVEAKKSIKNNLKSVIHVDGTSRIQSVVKEKKNNFFKILENLSKLDGLDMVLNTSLNLNNQTLANSPKDALRTFYCSGLDEIIMENFHIKKFND